MSEFTGRVDNLLVVKNLKRSEFCRDTNIPEGSYRQWIKGSVPNAEIVLKIAKYFGVSAEYLIAGEDAPTENNILLSDDENELIDIYRSLDKRGKNELLKIAQVLETERS